MNTESGVVCGVWYVVLDQIVRLVVGGGRASGFGGRRNEFDNKCSIELVINSSAIQSPMTNSILHQNRSFFEVLQ